MNNMISERRRQEDGRKKWPEALADIEADEAKAKARAEKYDRPINPVQAVSFQSRRCTEANRHHMYELSLENCAAFVERYRGDDSEAVKQFVHIVWYYRILDLMALGRFEDARKMGEQAKKAIPDFEYADTVKSMSSTWPR